MEESGASTVRGRERGGGKGIPVLFKMGDFLGSHRMMRCLRMLGLIDSIYDAKPGGEQVNTITC